VKPFWGLLPHRIEQAITGGWVRKFRAKYQRRNDSPAMAPARHSPRRLYVDLAVISRDDAGTGIQRVVRALALALTEQGTKEWDLYFVAADRRRPYHEISWPEAGAVVDPTEIAGRPGDLFLGLDFSLNTIRRYRRQLIRFRRNGGRFWFLICDLLPVEKPEWFSSGNVTRYKAWLDTIVGISDGFLCISAQTESDLKRVLEARYGLTGGYRTSIVPMGHDIRESRRDGRAIASPPESGRFDTSIPFSLMVGTLEPRKGHADILAAFSELWREGGENRLVLVGRMGWHVEKLRDTILTHSEYGGKLLWFDDVDDLELEAIYQACEGVIIASHAEGFGLPLIEALGHGKPVLARDLPIFSMHQGLGVCYFPSGAKSTDLALCIQRWTNAVQTGQIKVIRPSVGWQDSAKVLLSSIA
tara:strand:- start:7596 stop:8840 length:1245 start_codon:yes stop_codon:yes gene_type:complete